MMNSNKKLISVKLSEELINEIKEYIMLNDLSMTTLIKLALKEYLINHTNNKNVKKEN